MKSFNSLRLGTCALSLLFSTLSFAQGDKAGGGGFGFRLPDDSEILATKFIDRKVVTPHMSKVTFDPKILAELKVANKIAKRYYLDFFNAVTDPEKIDYEEVDTAEDIPQYCTFRTPKIKNGAVPVGANLGILACSVGNHTYFVKENIRGLSNHDFTILIQHEGLRRRSEVAEDYRADIIIANYEDTIDALLSYVVSLEKNSKARLSQSAVEAIELTLKDFEKMIIKAKDKKYEKLKPGEREKYDFLTKQFKSNPLHVHAYGGGLVADGAIVADSAFIEMAEIVPSGSVVGENSVYKNVTGIFQVGHDSTLENTVGKGKIGSHTVVRNANFNLEVNIGNRNHIEDSSFWSAESNLESTASLTTDDQVEVLKSHLEFLNDAFFERMPTRSVQIKTLVSIRNYDVLRFKNSTTAAGKVSRIFSKVVIVATFPISIPTLDILYGKPLKNTKPLPIQWLFSGLQLDGKTDPCGSRALYVQHGSLRDSEISTNQDFFGACKTLKLRN